MELNDWKDKIIEKSKKQISFRSNMSNTEIADLTTILFDYLEDGMLIIKNWRKLKDTTEFTNGQHDSGLIRYINDKYLANGREYYESFSSGGVSSSSKQSPESRLKSTCKQVM